MFTWRPIATLAFVLLFLWVSAVPAVADGLPDYEPDEFDLLFRTAPAEGLGEIGSAPAITGDSEVDALIRQIAEARGYRRRPLANSDLVWNDGVLMQPSMVSAWEALQAAASASGRPIGVTSGFRNHADQVRIFKGKLAGTSRSSIDTRLRTAAAPGYSKHHTGYALDIHASGQGFTRFGSTSAFTWLSADNADEAKQRGFIPSYPAGASAQGPIPEPWEWVYVGLDVVRCGRATIGMPDGLFDSGVSCPDYPLARGVAADLTARALGLGPSSSDAFSDDDGLSFEERINALATLGLVGGCGDDTFCPFDYLTRGSLASWVVTTFGLEDLQTTPSTFTDIAGSDHEEDISRLATAGLMDGCTLTMFCPEDRALRGDLIELVEAARTIGRLDAPGRFLDTIDSVFDADTRWLLGDAITNGCNPPLGDLFCPDDPVTRGQMAAFLVRALGLEPGSVVFEDVAGSVFGEDIAALAAAGITRGCDPPDNSRFCPDDPVTRGQMAAFLHRALG